MIFLSNVVLLTSRPAKKKNTPFGTQHHTYARLHTLSEMGLSTLQPPHTRDWEPVTITLQALSLMEKAEPVQVRFTLRLRHQRSMWMQDDRCKVDMDSYMASNRSCFIVHLHYLKKPPLGGRPNIKPRDHGTPNAHNRWFILFQHAWEPTWIEIHWNSIWLRAQSRMTSHSTWGSWLYYMSLGGVSGRPLDTFYWALTIAWSRLLAHVWSGPY